MTVQPDRAQAHLHRLDRGRQDADGSSAPARSRSSRWSSAATRPSSCSTMPTSTRRSQGAIASQVPQHRPDLRLRQPHLVQDGVYDAFAAKLAEAVRKLKVGDGIEGRDATRAR